MANAEVRGGRISVDAEHSFIVSVPACIRAVSDERQMSILVIGTVQLITEMELKDTSKALNYKHVAEAVLC